MSRQCDVDSGGSCLSQVGGCGVLRAERVVLPSRDLIRQSEVVGSSKGSEDE
jgi:hypothetical protein